MMIIGTTIPKGHDELRAHIKRIARELLLPDDKTVADALMHIESERESARVNAYAARPKAKV